MTTYQQKKIELFPQGYYPASITSVDTVNSQFDGEHSKQERFKFDLGNNRELLGWASGSFTTKSKMYRWAQAAVFQGQPVPDTYNLDTQHFIGKQVTLYVTQRTNANGTFNKVEDLLPAQIAPPPQTNLFAQNQADPLPGQPVQTSQPAVDQLTQSDQNLSQWAQKIT